MRQGLVVTIALLLTVDLWAGDPWKRRSSKDWDENDVREILNESPWAKRIHVEGDEKTHTDFEAQEKASGGEGGGNDEAGRVGETDTENEKSGTALVIRWVSSRTMREAWTRGQVLQKRIYEADAEKLRPSASDDYELLILGPGVALFGKSDEDALKQDSYLLAKKSKQRTNASRVELMRMPDGKGIRGILFHFPKKTQSGQPICSVDDKELKFVSRAGTTEIRTSFDLQKMVDKEGMDL